MKNAYLAFFSFYSHVLHLRLRTSPFGGGSDGGGGGGLRFAESRQPKRGMKEGRGREREMFLHQNDDKFMVNFRGKLESQVWAQWGLNAATGIVYISIRWIKCSRKKEGEDDEEPRRPALFLFLFQEKYSIIHCFPQLFINNCLVFRFQSSKISDPKHVFCLIDIISIFWSWDRELKQSFTTDRMVVSEKKDAATSSHTARQHGVPKLSFKGADTCNLPPFSPPLYVCVCVCVCQGGVKPWGQGTLPRRVADLRLPFQTNDKLIGALNWLLTVRSSQGQSVAFFVEVCVCMCVCMFSRFSTYILFYLTSYDCHMRRWPTSLAHPAGDTLK